MQHLTPCSSSQAPARRVQAVQFANQMWKGLIFL
jgi:hypothetical protein